jgi:N-acetylglucosamine repressor
VSLDMHGPRCSCGQRGCLEAYASKRATIARYRGADPSWPESLETGGVTIEHVMARARGGEERALEALRGTGYSLGRGFATLVKALDPKRIYVGGEITEVWDLVAPAVRDAMREDAVIREAGETEILTVALGEYPRLRGAAALIHTPAFAAAVVS